MTKHQNDDANGFPSWIEDPMELLLIHYFDPVWRWIKLRMLDWSLKNLPDFIEKISLKPSAISPEERVQLEEYLRCEVVFTVMQLCEDLAIAFETYKYSTPDAVKSLQSRA